MMNHMEDGVCTVDAVPRDTCRISETICDVLSVIFLSLTYRKKYPGGFLFLGVQNKHAYKTKNPDCSRREDE